MVAGKPGYVWTGTEWAPIGIPVEGADLGVTDHPSLMGRSANDSHPIAAVSNLQLELNSKSNIGHTHAEQVLIAGPGIGILEGPSDTLISNTDTGTDSFNLHVGETDPHAGIYAPEIHVHNYSPTGHTHNYAPDPHDHATLYDPLGEAQAINNSHVSATDPHASYLMPLDVIGGPGISSVDNGNGTVTLTNTAQNVGVAGYAAAQNTARNIPDSTWQGMQLDKLLLETIDATSGTTVATAGFTLGPTAPEGWYECNAAVAITGNATGRRMLRITVNGDPAGAPLIPQDSRNSLGGGVITFTQTSGPIYLRRGNRIAVEIWQNSGVQLQSSIDNTLMAIIFTGEAA